MVGLFIRITASELTKESLLKFFQELDNAPKCIVSEEVGDVTNKKHYHILVMLDSTNSNKNVRQNMKNALCKYFPSVDFKGNEHCSMKIIKENTDQKVASYTIKDDNYIFYGFSDSEIKIFERLSFKKFQKQTFKQELEQLETELILKDFDNRAAALNWYIDKYVDLRDKYKHNLNYNQVECHIQNVMRRAFPDYNRQFKRSLYDRLLLG